MAVFRITIISNPAPRPRRPLLLHVRMVPYRTYAAPPRPPVSVVGPQGAGDLALRFSNFGIRASSKSSFFLSLCNQRVAFGLGCNRDGESRLCWTSATIFFSTNESPSASAAIETENHASVGRRQRFSFCRPLPSRHVIVAPLQPRSFFLLWLLETVRTSAPSPQQPELLATNSHRHLTVRTTSEAGQNSVALRRGEAMPPRSSPFRFSPRRSKGPADGRNNSRANCSSNHRAAGSQPQASGFDSRVNCSSNLRAAGSAAHNRQKSRVNCSIKIKTAERTTAHQTTRRELVINTLPVQDLRPLSRHHCERHHTQRSVRLRIKLRRAQLRIKAHRAHCS